MADRQFVRPRLPLELADRIDVARGDVPFERWVRRALEAALDRLPHSVPVGPSVTDTSGPVSPTTEQERRGLENIAETVLAASPSDAQTFKCPAGHGVIEGAGPRARCFCNRPVVPA